MKIKLMLTLFLTAFITCFTVAQAHAVLVTLDVLDDYVMVGETFDVEVLVYDNGGLGDLTAFGFDVDPLGSLSLFSYDGYTVASDFDDVGYNYNNFLPANYVAGWYLGLGNAGQDVLLATLSFTTGSVTGTDTLDIEGIFDSWDYGLFYEFGDEHIAATTYITINSAPIPEPCTILLFGAGLPAIAVFRKRFRNG